MRGTVAPCNAAAETFVNEAAPSARIIVTDDKMLRSLFFMLSPFRKYKSLSTNFIQDTKLTILLAGIGRNTVIKTVSAGRKKLHTPNYESMRLLRPPQTCWAQGGKVKRCPPVYELLGSSNKDACH